ncbi:MAG: hypothetical protein ACRDSN_15315 [Pseudonocardiaceae bacterium]
MLLDIVPDSIDAAVLDAMETFCRAWAPTYDLVFFTHDHYSQPSDGFRAKVAGLQDTAATALRGLYQQLDVTVVDIPLEYETAQTRRVDRPTGRRGRPGRPRIACGPPHCRPA